MAELERLVDLPLSRKLLRLLLGGEELLPGNERLLGRFPGLNGASQQGRAEKEANHDTQPNTHTRAAMAPPA